MLPFLPAIQSSSKSCHHFNPQPTSLCRSNATILIYIPPHLDNWKSFPVDTPRSYLDIPQCLTKHTSLTSFGLLMLSHLWDEAQIPYHHHHHHRGPTDSDSCPPVYSCSSHCHQAHSPYAPVLFVQLATTSGPLHWLFRLEGRFLWTLSIRRHLDRCSLPEPSRTTRSEIASAPHAGFKGRGWNYTGWTA